MALRRFLALILGVLLFASFSAAPVQEQEQEKKTDTDKSQQSEKQQAEEHKENHAHQEHKRGLWKRLFQSLTPEERQTLRENLRKFKELSPEERKKIRQLLHRFNKYAKKKGLKTPFLRRYFMIWLGTHITPEKIQELKKLAPEERREQLEKLFDDFKAAVLKKVEDEKLLSPSELEELKKLPPDEQWAKVQEIWIKHVPKLHKKD